MKDLNFFIGYSEVTQESKNIKYVITVIAGILLALILSSTIWYIVSNVMLNANIKKINLQINAADFQREYSKAENLQKRQDILNNYLQASSNIVNVVNEKDKVSIRLINEINSCMPSDVAISNISISGGVLQLNCSAKSRISAAQFNHNITKLNSVDSTSFSYINYESTKKGYTFLIKCLLKDVVQNADK